MFEKFTLEKYIVVHIPQHAVIPRVEYTVNSVGLPSLSWRESQDMERLGYYPRIYTRVGAEAVVRQQVNKYGGNPEDYQIKKIKITYEVEDGE